MLDVELGEKFYIDGEEESGEWWFDENGLHSEKNTQESCEYLLSQLLAGKKEIKFECEKFTPKDGQFYYYFDYDSFCFWTPRKKLWSSDSLGDLINNYIGNCFRSRKQTRKCQKELIIDRLRDKYLKDIDEQ